MTVPIDIDRDDAREAARRELADPIYAENEPSWLTQVLDWIAELLDDIFDALAEVAPGGVTGLIVLAVAVLVAVVAIRLRLGRIAAIRRLREGAALDDRTISAAQHRTAAENALAAGDLDAAVTERFRAIVRELEQRALIDVQYGRTADEVAAVAGAAIPAAADALRAAASAFDDVYYGGRPATPQAYRTLVEVDELVCLRHLAGAAS